MMLAARLLCSGERPESLQRLFQAACRFRLSANGATNSSSLPFISPNLPRPLSSVKVNLTLHPAFAAYKIINQTQGHR